MPLNAHSAACADVPSANVRLLEFWQSRLKEELGHSVHRLLRPVVQWLFEVGSVQNRADSTQTASWASAASQSATVSSSKNASNPRSVAALNWGR